MKRCKKPEECLYEDDRCRVSEACLREEISKKNTKPVTACPCMDSTSVSAGMAEGCSRKLPTCR